jgi:outer membrane protein assembly factor BamB
MNIISSSSAIGIDGTVYVGSQDTYLYAINPDGTMKWKFKGGSFESSPAIGAAAPNTANFISNIAIDSFNIQ